MRKTDENRAILFGLIEDIVMKLCFELTQNAKGFSVSLISFKSGLIAKKSIHHLIQLYLSHLKEYFTRI